MNESVELKQVIQLYTDDEKWCLNNGEVFSYQLNYHNEKRVSNSMIFTPELLIEGSYQKVSFLKWENRTNRPNANNKSINLFLELFNNLIGFSDDGVFSISNHGINWYGNTLNNMLSLVNQFNSKYSGLETEHLHHSEKIAYYDPLYLSYSVIFDIYLGGLDFNGEDDEYYIRWFEPFMLIPDKLKLSETYERINKISELGNFKIVEESVKIEKKYIFLENFSVKLTNLEPIYRKGYIIGAKIENPCNYNNELKSYLLTHFPLLVCEENWFVFLIDHLTEIDEEIFLKGIEYNKIKMYGSFLFLIRIEINW